MRKIALFFYLLWPSVTLAQPLQVSVTLKPLHSLTARLMSGVGEPNLIVRGGLSPHHYTPRPSETRALHQSDLVIWVGPSVEPGLAKTLKTLAPTVRVLTLIELRKLNLLPARKLGDWSQETKNIGNQDHKDPHFWLDPLRVVTAAQAITRALILADPTNIAIYEANLVILTADLGELERDLRSIYEPLLEKPVFVFHDAYQYLENRYQLRVLGSLTVSAERSPGARRVSRIKAQIRQAKVTCVLHEPQFKPSLIRVLTEDTGARMGTIDPLGSGIPAGSDHYFIMMRVSAAAIQDCLAPTG